MSNPGTFSSFDFEAVGELVDKVIEQCQCLVGDIVSYDNEVAAILILNASFGFLKAEGNNILLGFKV